MSTTPHLALPLLAAAQAQKHVTHNEALASLDALVHLSVKERNRAAAPGSPEEGDRYLVGEGAVGSFAGHEGEVALFDAGIWRFLQPRTGWRVHVEAEGAVLVFDGAAWTDLGHFIRDLRDVGRLGIGTAPDDLNRLSAKLNAALFSALYASEAGTGDLRFVLNKEGPDDVLSQLYQSGYGGRAETGLIGSDDFRIRVSPDGSVWHDAMRIDRNTGIVSFPGGLAGNVGASGVNLLINSTLAVNQRSFAGGALSAGIFGYDRWKGGTGGCSVSRASDGTITLVGLLEQIVEASRALTLTGAATLAGATLTLSVEDLTAPLQVNIGTRSATIEAGAGRRSATVTLGTSETGNVSVRLQSSGAVSFKRIKLEVGAQATPWVGERLEVEEFSCRRYYQRVAVGTGTPAMLGALGYRAAGNAIEIPCTILTPMRAGPVLLGSGFSWASASPVGNQIGFYDIANGGWVSLSGSLLTSATNVSPVAFALKLQAGTSFSGTAGTIGNLYFGNAAFLALQAEL